MRKAAAIALAAGITTVRDLGDRGYLGVRLRDELAEKGPHIVAAGPPITVPKGHCWFLGGEAAGVQGVRAAVREHKERGADVIKVMATGGELTKGTRSTEVSFTLPELRAIVQEAQRLDLPTTAHAHAAQGIAYVAEAGFEMVEHCSFMTGDGAHADEATIEALRRSGIIISATLGAVPGMSKPTPYQAMIPQFVAVFTRLRQEGLTIVCSSDAGIARAKPHDVLPHAVAMMVETNAFPLVDALRAVTSVAASALRLGDRKGRVAPGFDADLLAVRGNPLHDVHALREVEAVFAGGRRVR
jgi:imidazolonepropionase-like amidohydrolase